MPHDDDEDGAESSVEPPVEVQPEVQPEIQPQIVPPSRPQRQDDRITVDITPQELVDLYNSVELTSDAQRLVAPYIGKWMRVLVVIEDSPLSVYQRDAIAYRALIGIDMPKDVMVYTRQEFEQRASLSTSFEKSVKQEGRIVYAA